MLAFVLVPRVHSCAAHRLSAIAQVARQPTAVGKELLGGQAQLAILYLSGNQYTLRVGHTCSPLSLDQFRFSKLQCQLPSRIDFVIALNEFTLGLLLRNKEIDDL